MKRLHTLLIVLALWAGIFLPGLGSTELKGEEGRRILPAVTMLETGNWVVPYVAGKPFLRKPPLVNWAIAASFQILQVRNEWTARLPSVVALLVLALSIAALGGSDGWMSNETALVAAILSLTQVAVIEKGRMAEIEAIYAACSGLGILFWLAWWTQRRSAWLVWTVPFAFLGVALLAKGPMHLVFFYAIVLAVLWRTGEWRQLWHPAHAAGLLLLIGIFATWYFPYHHDPAAQQASQVWGKQMEDHLSGKFHLASWLLNIPRSLSDHLPWLLLAPLLWRRDLDKLGPRDAAIFRGVRLAVTLCFLVILLPGVLPRYTLPLSMPYALILAVALADSRLSPPSFALRAWWRSNSVLAAILVVAACAGPVALAIGARRSTLGLTGARAFDFTGLLVWSIVASAGAFALCLAALVRRWKLARPALIASTSAAVIAAGMFLYSADITPFMNAAETLRPEAEAINRFVPPEQKLSIYDPEYQAVIFYLQAPYSYADSVEGIPSDAAWVLTREERRERLQRLRPEFEVVRQFAVRNYPPLVLLHRRS